MSGWNDSEAYEPGDPKAVDHVERLIARVDDEKTR